MIKYFGNKDYLKLIDLLKRYDEESGSFFASNEYQKLAETAFKDIDIFEEKYQEKYAVSIEENLELDNKCADQIAEINKEQEIKKQANAEEMKNKIDDFKAEQEKQKTELLTKYHEIDQSYIPLIKSVDLHRNEVKEKYHEDLKQVREKYVLYKSEYQHNLDDVDDETEKQLIEKNISISLTKENSEQTIPSIEEKYQEKEAEEVNDNEEKLADLNHKIAEQRKYIMDNTVKLNESISSLAKDINEQKNNSFIPYDDNIAKLNVERQNTISTFNKINTTILDDFKNNILRADNELSELHNLQRNYEKSFNDNYAFFKTNHQKIFSEKINKYDAQIAKLKSKYAKGKNKEDLKSLNSLIKYRSKLAKKMDVEFNIASDKMKKDFLNGIYNYLIQIEKERSKKIKYDLMKNMALHNMDLEKDSEINILNAKINNLSKEKDNYSLYSQFEENIQSLHLRLTRDLENNDIQHKIKDLESQIKFNEEHLKYRKLLLTVEKQKEIDFLGLSNDYRIKVINNDKDLVNIKNLLLMQRNDMQDETNKELTNLAVSYLKDKFINANKRDDLNYESYKTEHDYENKKIDREMLYIEDAKKLYSNYLNDVEALINKRNELDATYTTEKIKSQTYKDRYEIEKLMILDAFDLLHKELNKIINFENYLLSTFCAFKQDIFNNIKFDTILLMLTLNNLKLSVIDDYYNKVVEIINNRISFVNKIKYQKIIDSIKNETDYNTTKLKEKSEGISQTMLNYNETLKNYLGEQRAVHVEQEILKRELEATTTYSDEEKRKELDLAIKTATENMASINEKIKNIKKFILDLATTSEEVKKQIEFNAKRYSDEIAKINKNQEDDAKKFKEVLDSLEKATKAIKDTLNPSVQILNDPRFDFAHAVSMSNKLIINNNLLLSTARSKYTKIALLLENAVKEELKNLENNFIENRIKSIHDINELINSTNKVFENNKHTMEKNFVADITSLNLNQKKDIGTIQIKLQALNNDDLNKKKEYEAQSLKINKKLAANLQLNDDNLLEYEQDCRDNQERLTDEYKKRTSEINSRTELRTKRIKAKYQIAVNNFANNQKKNMAACNVSKKIILEEYKNNVNHYKNRQKDVTKNINDNAKIAKDFIDDINKSLKVNLDKNHNDYYKQIKVIDNSLLPKANENFKNYQKDLLDKNK